MCSRETLCFLLWGSGQSLRQTIPKGSCLLTFDENTAFPGTLLRPCPRGSRVLVALHLPHSLCIFCFLNQTSHSAAHRQMCLLATCRRTSQVFPNVWSPSMSVLCPTLGSGPHLSSPRSLFQASLNTPATLQSSLPSSTLLHNRPCPQLLDIFATLSSRR